MFEGVQDGITYLLGERQAVKTQAAIRWVNAVNADGRYTHWHYAMARKPEEVRRRIEEMAQTP